MELIDRKSDINKRDIYNILEGDENSISFQVSYNYPQQHIVLRWFKKDEQENDYLIVLSEKESGILINFIKYYLNR